MPDKISERVISIVTCTFFVSALLLFAAAAQAQQVFTDPDNPNTVIRIENLVFVTRGGGDGVYTVDFRYETGLSVFGPNLEDFDFEGIADQDDAVFAMRAVNDALNESGLRIPDSAGVPSENVFYVGVREQAGFIGAVGGEFMGSTAWQRCEPPNCVLGVAIQGPNTLYTWADFTEDNGTSNSPPVADAGGPYGGTAGVVLAFDGTGSTDPDDDIATYEWDFGDGSPLGTGEKPTHTYAAPGVYSVALTVRDAIGIPDTTATAAVIGLSDVPPAAHAGGPYVDLTGTAISFDGSASTDFDGDVVAWSWDFGDGSPLGTGETLTHTYAVDDLYPVTLTVTDNDDLTNTDDTSAVVGSVGPPPVADAGGPYGGSMGVAIDFDGTDSTAGFNVESRQTVLCGSDFATSTPCKLGDGTATGILNLDVNGVLYDVEFIFDFAADTFTLPFIFNTEQEAVGASLDVANALNAVADVTAVSQNSYYDIPFEFDVGTGYKVQSADYFPISSVWRLSDVVTILPVGTPSSFAVFTAVPPTPDSDIVSFAWDFGDASAPGSGATVSHTYAASGLYDVTLTVTDGTTATDADTVMVPIGDGNLPPIPDAGGLVIGAPGAPVTFDGDASVDPEGGVLTYAWDFGDGSAPGIGATPTHTYAAADVYNVTLTVTDDAGAPSSDGAVALIQNQSDLSIGTITGSPDPVLTNQTFTLNVPIDNNGPNDEPNALATITLAADIMFTSATSSQGTCIEALGVIKCGLGSIVSGGGATITVTAQAPPQTGALAVSVTVDGVNFDPDLNNNEAVSIGVSAFDIGSVTTKAKGGGSIGVFGLLLLALATMARRSRRVRRSALSVLLSTGILCGLLLGVPGTSQAQDSGWYAGLGYGASEADYDTDNFVADMAALGHVVTDFSIDDSSEGWKAFGGYNFNDYFAGELAYVDLGEVTADIDGFSLDVPQMVLDANSLLPVMGAGISIAGIGRYPFAERWSIFAKAGVFFWESDQTLNNTGGSAMGSTSPTSDGTDVMYGVGGDVYFNGHFGLRVEWERYALDPNDVDLVSASVLFRF